MTHPSEEGKPTLLLKTKLHMPHIAGSFIPRPHLVERLNRNLDRKLTLISAPAGYGKTTLMAAWLRSCERPSAWLSLDKNDNDLVLFTSYFMAAIRTISPNAYSDTLGLLGSLQTPTIEYLVGTLINEIDAQTDPILLALDDYHFINDEAVQQLLARLITYQPSGLHLVIATRSDPLLPLPRLRADRQMFELRSEDLRFSAEEAEQFLRNATDGTIDYETTTAIKQRTEGWIAGIQLAALSVQRTRDRAAFLDNFRGDTNIFVLEYLVDEVLVGQPADVQQFLLLTAIFERFCADLCDAVTEQPAGQGLSILEELKRANLFLVPLDEKAGWFRYHHLFQQMLLGKLLSQKSPDEIADLHRRASKWLGHHGYIEEALHHALKANDVQAASELVEENSQNLLNRLERHTLERWLAMLPEEVVWVRPRLLIAQAWLLYRQWRLRSLDVVLERAITALDVNEETFTSGEKRFLWGQIHTLRSVTYNFIHNNFQRSLEAAEHALLYLPLAERGARSIALIFLAFAQRVMGEKNTAIRLLEEAIHDPSHLSPSHIQAYLGLCFLRLIAGELPQMQQTTQKFLVFATENKNANAIVAANWVSGLLHYEWNNLDAAEYHFSVVMDHRYSSNFAAAFNSKLGLIRISQVQGELDNAQMMIDGLRSETLRLDISDHQPLLDSIQANQWLLKGDLASAQRWARSYHPDELHESLVHFELPKLTRARVLVSGSTKSELQEVQQELEEGLIAAEGRHFTQRVIQILAHLALVHQGLGCMEAALETLEGAVLKAQPGGFIRSFVDAGSSLVPLFQNLHQRNIAPDYLSQVLEAFNKISLTDSLLNAGGKPASYESEILDLLTRREEEILRLMGEGLTNQEIANELVISLYTVKRHATNIYHKLSVTNRRGAIRKFRRLGMLPS